MTGILCGLLTAYLLVLFAHVIFSWVPQPPEPLVPVRRVIHAVTEPVLSPLRRLIPPIRMGGAALDLSILIVFFGIILLQSAVC